jgi:hypothetical protein
MKNYTKLSFYTFFISAFVLQSCRTVYTPTAVSVPLLQEKGEIRAYISPTNAQVAYAVTDHLGVIANGRFSNWEVTTTINDKTDNYNSKLTDVEIGAGYLAKSAKGLIFEGYGGLGFASANFTDVDANKQPLGEKFTSTGFKAFVQPNIGFTSNGFDMALSTRLSGIKFGKAETTYSLTKLKEYSLDKLAENTHLFLEPAITLRGGYKWVKLQAQFGASVKLTEATIPHNPFFGSIGLSLNLAKWYDNLDGKKH